MWHVLPLSSKRIHLHQEKSKYLRLLFVVPYTPTPIRTRPYHLIKSLIQRNYDLTLATLWSDSNEYAALKQWEEVGIRVLAQPITRQRSLWNVARFALNAAPWQASFSWHPRFNALLTSAIQNNPFNVIHVEHLRGARYGLSLREQLKRKHAPTPLIWDSVDCISELLEQTQRSSTRRASRLMARVELPRTRGYEPRLVTLFSRTLVVSNAERAAFLKLLQAARLPNTPYAAETIRVVPNGVDLEFFSPSAVKREPATILFSGKMSYHANVTAAQYLLDEIFPRVRQQVPNARIIIAGKDPPANLVARHSDFIEITGTVDDLRPYFARATVACAPILYGAGIQNKILEAMAMGTAVVTTSKALDGINARPGHDLLIGDDAAALAAALVQIIQDAARRNALEQNGRSYVEANHRWSHSASVLDSVYQEAIAQQQLAKN